MPSSLAPSSFAVVLAVLCVSENTPENCFLGVVCIKFMRVFKGLKKGKNRPFCTRKILINDAVPLPPLDFFKLPLGVAVTRRGITPHLITVSNALIRLA